MHYLIDGHNLIAQMADIDLDDPNDEALLVLQLRSWVAAGRTRQVTVIFDGGLPGGRSRFHSNHKLNVIFASEGRTADALLMRRIQKVKNPAEYALISSDQQVVDAARARRMKYLGTDEFAKRLAEFRQQEESPSPVLAPGEAEEPLVSQAEVAEWLAMFDAAPKVRREPPKPRPRQAAEERPAATEKAQPKPAKRDSVDPAVLKRGDDKLSADDVDDWLKLFGQGK